MSKNNKNTSFGYVNTAKEQWARERGTTLGKDNGLIPATVTEVRDNWVEATVSWFSILNSFFIIALASLFSRWWDSRYNPPAAVKYGIGLLMLSVGFGLLAIGSSGVTHGVKVSMLWLFFAYMFNTMGELCLSPVGLSYVSKLVPGRMIAFMFGVWYLAVAIGHKLAAVVRGADRKHHTPIQFEYFLFDIYYCTRYGRGADNTAHPFYKEADARGEVIY